MAKKASISDEQFQDLLCQALETELGGVQIYQKALTCALDNDLREEWERYLAETKNHVTRLKQVFATLGLDPEMQTPGRKVVSAIGQSLVQAMKLAEKTCKPEAAEIFAAECVVFAETKDHANWELIGQLVERAQLENIDALKEAFEEIEEQEDEHLYHTKGWARELSLQALGLPAVLPPPEEKKNVKSAIGAERAKQARDEMRPRHKH